MTSDLFVLLSTIIASGGFGGILGFCNKFTIYSDLNAKDNIFKDGKVVRGNEKVVAFPLDEISYFGYYYCGAAIKKKHLAWIAFFQMLLGIGGAMAVAFILIPLKQFPYTVSNESLLFLTTLGVVAGFGGNRMLEKVRGQLENQIADTQQDVSKLKATMSNLKKEKNYDLEATDALNHATAILDNPNHGKSRREVEQAVKYLETIVKHHEHFERLIVRRATIYLGRIYRAYFKDLNLSIEHLTRFINRFGDIKDEHLAAVLYNRACYNALKAVTKKGQARDKCFQLAKEDLDVSFEIEPESQTDLVGDDEGHNPDPDLAEFKVWLNEKEEGLNNS